MPPDGSIQAAVLPPFEDWAEGFQVLVAHGAIAARPGRLDTLEEAIEAFDGRVLTVHGFDNGVAHVLGSAVMVGEGIAIGASHVFQEYAQRFGPAMLAERCYLAGFRKGQLQLWKVQQVLAESSTDVAILTLALCGAQTSPIHVSTWDISMRFPSVGDGLLVVGYSADNEGAFLPAGDNVITIHGTMRSSAGQVTAIYPEGRDRLLLPFPCFEFVADVRGGMSGGPVFNDRGHLVGVVSTSLLDEQGNDHRCWAASLAPVMADTFQPRWPHWLFPEPIRVIDQARVHDRDRFSIDRVGNWHLKLD